MTASRVAWTWSICDWLVRVASLAVVLVWLGPLQRHGGPNVYPWAERSDAYAFWPILLDWDGLDRDHGFGLAIHRRGARAYVEFVLTTRPSNGRGAVLEHRVPLFIATTSQTPKRP